MQNIYKITNKTHHLGVYILISKIDQKNKDSELNSKNRN